MDQRWSVVFMSWKESPKIPWKSRDFELHLILMGGYQRCLGFDVGISERIITRGLGLLNFWSQLVVSGLASLWPNSS